MESYRITWLKSCRTSIASWLKHNWNMFLINISYENLDVYMWSKIDDVHIVRIVQFGQIVWFCYINYSLAPFKLDFNWLLLVTDCTWYCKWAWPSWNRVKCSLETVPNEFITYHMLLLRITPAPILKFVSFFWIFIFNMLVTHSTTFVTCVTVTLLQHL